MANSDDTIPRIITRPLPNAVTYDLSSPDRVTITLPPSSTWSSGLHWHESHTEYLQVLRGSIKVRLGDREQIVSASPGNQPEITVPRYAWHESHTEYLQVLRGSIKVRLGDREQIVSASPGNQPEITVPRYAWHEWRRADPHGGEDVVVSERTEPADGEKALFFWNLNGVILDAPRMLDDGKSFISRCPAGARGPLLDLWITLNLFVIFYHLDNVPVFVDFPDLVRGRKESAFIPRRVLVLGDWVVSHVVLFVASWVGWLLNARPLRLKYTPAREYAAWMEKKHRHTKDA
ncbi:uncharacterized protein DNG_06152 [Cephalotrichum gorgonifer]|uniref:Uncharacterized protein n=1 Tax=Cephalotrichum gorgonifer TaxID=2041049 RepID=A0AAE8N0Y8_9PEZI|nr:uncharacterized protein DNG_06152 [Cephalotrichum gorgonifer]